jgi:hypothetical protein
MMSSIDTAPRQFQEWTGHPSNIDKCARCQLPRSVHGADWSCPPALPGRLPAVLLAAGVVLMVAGIVVRVFAGSPGQATLLADVFMAGVALAVAGFVTGGRR